MSNIAKLEFKALAINIENYFLWKLDAKIHLQSKRLGDAIEEENKMSLKDKASALIFLHHHIHEDLKNEYLTEEDSLGLWKSLKDRYDHQRMVMLANAQNEWMNLRFQDYKTVSEYNSNLFNIVPRLRLCGENVTEKMMIDKTLSTFHPSNVILQEQYRGKQFLKYSDLVTVLLVLEQNNNILMRNHNIRPTGAMAFPEANANFGQSRGRGRGRGRNNHPSRGGYKNSYKRGWHNNPPSRGGYKGPRNDTKFKNHQKGFIHHNKKNSNPSNASGNNQDQMCYRCGKHGHWTRVCRTPKHEVDQYKASINFVETNNLDGHKLMEALDDYGTDNLDITHFDSQDFFQDADGNPISNEAFNAMLGAPPT